jgi:hypothetical protein
VDELACSLHHPTVYSHQRGGQSSLTGTAPSCHAAVGGTIFLGDVKPLGLDILCGIDHPGTCKTESYIKKLAFIRVGLSNVKVIMVIMRVPLVELMYQAVMEQISALEYLLPSARGACGHVLSCQTINASFSRYPSVW